jgi:molecular chaperone GrpE
MTREDKERIKEKPKYRKNDPEGKKIVVDETQDEEVIEGELEPETEFVDPAILQEELEKLRAKSEEYLDGWQRERAEFANFKKRMERERDQMKQNLTGDLIRRYLEVLDDLERALKNRPAEGEGATWAAGIELVYRKLFAILEQEGIEKLEVEGEIFDPNLHEAISHEANNEYESGQVIEVIKNGYRIGERILRPALVRVAQ